MSKPIELSIESVSAETLVPETNKKTIKTRDRAEIGDKVNHRPESRVLSSRH